MTATPSRTAAVGLLAILGAAGFAACSGSDSSDASTAGSSPSDLASPVTADAATTTTTAATAVESPPATTTTGSDVSTGSMPATDDGAPTTEPVTLDPGPLSVPSIAFVEVGTYEAPVGLAYRDFGGDLFVVEQGGRIIASNADGDRVVFDIDDVDGIALSTGNEQGLLGLAFHPTDDLAYIDLTNEDGTTVIAELAIDAETAAFDPTSYREVLTIDQPYRNHNGGGLVFGPDGLLYIGTGDGGSADDPERTALDLTSRLGKLLRIDPRPDGDRPFTVPGDNPFLGADDADPTIWSYGLRNPWRFSFDPATNDLWIGDVGQNRVEEIDLAPSDDGADAGRGLSFGWSAFEGGERFNEDQPGDGHVPPVHTYEHADGNCSVSAGAVARRSSVEALDGWYVFGDFCSGRIWALDTTSVTVSDATVVGDPVVVELGEVPQLTAIGEGPDGDLYALSITGSIVRLGPG